jgi:hypothetical protein
MAQKVQVVLSDDLDGGPADETVTFALDGTGYEIDLSVKNAEALRNAFADYVGHARRSGRSSGSGPRRRTATTATPRSSSSDNAAVRSWAKENGYDVSERGRISAAIREAYDKANG